jgi:teichuronic acid biosynthesis glycosyltransferase TuaC
MKVLFVSSGNTKDGISPIIKNQGLSLIKQGIDVDFFTIKGKGFWSYVRHIFILRKHIKSIKYDIIHAHYSYTSYVSALSGARPLVVSLMGSDVKARQYPKILMLIFYKHFWDKTIVKSQDMYHCLGFRSPEIIPNGVDIVRFSPLDKADCKSRIGWEKETSHFLFAADPTRTEKNFCLLQKAINLLTDKERITLHFLNDIPHEKIPDHLNAADIIVLSSLHEGSPNTIKEAMACNCPIVATEVGDIKWVFGETAGCYLTGFDEKDVAEKLELALRFSQTIGKTKGRDRIIELHLDSETIAHKLIEVYKKTLNR